MASRLTKEIKDIICHRDNNSLAFLIADKINISVTLLRQALGRDQVSLTTLPVLRIISNFTGKGIDELIEEYAKEETETEMQQQDI
jgi:hypothetical protein